MTLIKKKPTIVVCVPSACRGSLLSSYSHCWAEQGLVPKVRAPPGKRASASGKWLFKPGLVGVTRAPQRGTAGGVLCRAPAVFLCWWIKVKRGIIIREGQPVCSVPGKLVHSYLLQLTFPALLPVSLHDTGFKGVKEIAPDCVIRKTRTGTQYLGLQTLWLSHRHIHGEGVRSWGCDGEPGVLCCADREKLSFSSEGCCQPGPQRLLCLSLPIQVTLFLDERMILLPASSSLHGAEI